MSREEEFIEEVQMKKLFTGNEAIARGAYEAGVKFAAAYPGTPSTEILENISQYKELYSEWAPNEKVALEAAIGASMAGARAMASMKHVGVNVAADPLFTFAYTGVNGGMVLITADEPGMHSSQNEQDNRNYAKFAKIPMLEPADSQEAKDMLKVAFDISETYDTPVLFRITTRISHSKGIVECYDRVEKPVIPYETNIPKFVAVPGNARKRRHIVEDRMNLLYKYSNETPLNYEEMNDTKIGVIASGMSFTYAKEVFGDDASYFKLGFTNPLPMDKLKAFAEKVDKIYVIEENDPIIEEQLKANGVECHGSDVFPYCGEMTADVIRKSVFGDAMDVIDYDQEKVAPRPPILCAGCPHRGFAYEIGRRKNLVKIGDIGCYSLIFGEPYNAMEAGICMGSAFSIGHGIQKVFNMENETDKRVIAFMGDSTFFHTGINSLTDVIYNNSNSINVILDNRITGMTGHQENPGSGYTASGDVAASVEIEAVVRAIGIKNVRTIDPNDLEVVKETLDWALALDEPSVIITRWPCVLKKFSPEDKAEFVDAFTTKCTIDSEECIGCKKCIKVGCPSISFDNDTKKAMIDPFQCVGCEVCLQVCPVNAISKEEK